MFGIGVAELLVVVLLVTFVILSVSFVRGGRFRTILTRLSERAALRDGDPLPTPQTSRHIRRLSFPAPLLVALPAGALAILVYGYFALTRGPLSSGQVRWSTAALEAAPVVYVVLLTLTVLLPLLAFLPAIWLHFRPGHDRRRKYKFLLAGASSAAFGFLTIYLDVATLPQIQSENYYSASYSFTAEPLLVLAILVVLNPVVVMAVLDACTSTWRRRRLAGRSISRGLIQFHVFLRRGTVPLVFLCSSHPLLLLYLFLRYHVREVLAEAPIVYLRSFGHEGGPAAFGSIVVKAARTYGVVTALVHRSQPSSRLLRVTNVFDQGIIERVPDAHWQEWVRSRLEHATAVILDTTVASEGLGWELEAALASVPHSRIAILVEKGSPIPEAEGVLRLEYALDARSAKAARRELSAWLRGVVDDRVR